MVHSRATDPTGGALAAVVRPAAGFGDRLPPAAAEAGGD
jgi:hypothetical protein